MDDVISDQVREIVATTFGIGPEQVSDETSAQTLATWTSLAHLRLVANLEHAFGIRFTMDEMTSMTSVQMIESILAARGVSV